jgi:hypothetical protein
MNETYKWDPLASVVLGFLLSFIILGFSILQPENESLSITNSATLAKLMIQLLGPAGLHAGDHHSQSLT